MKLLRMCLLQLHQLRLLRYVVAHAIVCQKSQHLRRQLQLGHLGLLQCSHAVLFA